jgi:hypothetical protein
LGEALRNRVGRGSGPQKNRENQLTQWAEHHGSWGERAEINRAIGSEGEWDNYLTVMAVKTQSHRRPLGQVTTGNNQQVQRGEK